jgi:hypothetical protein
LNDIFGMWWRRSALCLWGIGRSEPERDEHPTIPGPAECTPFNGHKKIKGDKVVVCDRNCKVIAPFVAAPGNHSEAPLLRAALPNGLRIARSVGLELQGTIVSLNGGYDCRQNRKALFNRGMVPNINANPRGRKSAKRGRKPLFIADISRNASIPLSACLVGKISDIM